MDWLFEQTKEDSFGWNVLKILLSDQSKLYKDFYNRATTSLIDRYPSDELEELEMLENVSCKPCSEVVAHVFKKYKMTCAGAARLRPLCTRYRRATSLPKTDEWSWNACLWRTWPPSLMSTICRTCPCSPHPADSLIVYACPTCSAERSFTQQRRNKDYLPTTRPGSSEQLQYPLHPQDGAVRYYQYHKGGIPFHPKYTTGEHSWGPIKLPMYWAANDY